jgi:hypothetical protein
VFSRHRQVQEAYFHHETSSVYIYDEKKNYKKYEVELAIRRKSIFPMTVLQQTGMKVQQWPTFISIAATALIETANMDSQTYEWRKGYH